MSATDDAPEAEVDTDDVGGLGEILPEPLVPVWDRIERLQAFRETHGETYTKVLEAVVAVVLIAGYVYWLTLYLG